MIEKEERNRIMDGEIGWWESHKHTSFDTESPVSKAIRECDKLARAWDALEKEVQVEIDRANKKTISLWSAYMCVQARMKHLLSPPPKDPLEELEQWVNNSFYFENPMFNKEGLLTEIRRLRGKK